MKRTLALSPWLLLFGVAFLVGLFGCLFARWTASSAYSFPGFLIACPLFLYLPGRCLLDSGRANLLPLEHLSLSLVLGLVSSSVVYWLAVFVGAPLLFLLWPLAAVVVCACRLRRNWPTLLRWRPVLDVSHLLLVGVLAIAVSLLAVMPSYYRNLTLRPDKGLDYLDCADVSLHVSLANELTHSVPPQTPFIAGQRLSYHYANDLPAACFSACAGISTLDLTVRFMPTFYLLMTGLAVFSFSRAWLSSGRAAALVTFLVLLGEDFSFIPGWWLASDQCWAAQFFSVPTTYSLYSLNPMLPALGMLCAGLFCLVKLFREGGKHWLLLTALLFAVILEYKVFIAAQLLLALFLAAPLYLFLHRDWRPLAVFGLTALFMAILALPMWQANAEGAHQTLAFQATHFLPRFLQQMGWAEGRWGRRILHLLGSGGVTWKGLFGLLAVVPLYLAGSLGGRLLGLPRLLRDLFTPAALSMPRFVLALFVIAGPLLTLTCVVASQDKPLAWQYNNAVWFFVQSKYLAWLFAVEFLCAAAWLRTRGRRALAGLVLVALAVPATIQFVVHFSDGHLQNTAVLPSPQVEVMSFLAERGAPGQVAMGRRELGLPLSALTCCRSPLCPSMGFADQFVGAAELRRRSQDWDDFWDSWEQGTVRADTLLKYGVAYLVVDKDAYDELASGASGPPHDNGSQTVLLQRCFENEGFLVYRVRPLAAGKETKLAMKGKPGLRKRRAWWRL